MRVVQVLLTVGLLAACGGTETVTKGVTCSGDADCKIEGATGSCQSGYCAFADPSCADGLRYSPAAGSMANQCVGGDAACGTQGTACCANDVCGPDLACTSGTCTCGDVDGAPCCSGTTCGANLSCNTAGTCACGAFGEACCGGSTCDTGTTCSSGTCTATYTQVAIGHSTMCGVRSDGVVQCWGYDPMQYGRSSPSATHPVIGGLTPVVIANATDVAEMRGGEGHFCARKTDNTLWCWGHNERGQLGNGTRTSSTVATQVSGLSGVTAFDLGRHHTCAIGTVNAVAGIYCWGRNGLRNNHPTSPNLTETMSRLGNNDIADSATPVAVNMTQMAATGQTPKAVATAGYHSCAIMSDDRAWCWGYNGGNQLGDNTATSSKVPVLVDLSQLTIPNGVTMSSMTSGKGYSSNGNMCIRFSDGTATCWGQNYVGQWGIGTTTTASRPTAFVTMTALAGATFTQLVGFNQATCGLDTTGKVWCWGSDKAGQLGDNDTTEASKSTPVQVQGLPTGITKIVAGHRNVCAFDATNKVWCWGSNRVGQLTRTVPVTQADSSVLQPIEVRP